MSRRPQHHKSQHHKSQQGFLIPLAAIILVGVAVLALAIGRISGQTHIGSRLEGISVQAFYAAESGAQFGMNQLFYNVDDRPTADGNCAALSGASIDFTNAGMTTCDATISCTRSIDVGDTTSFYLITSAASCGVGELTAERIIQISAFIQ